MGVAFNLNISDEKLQAKAEEIGVWNFAKKARKVINVLQGELETTQGPNGKKVHELIKPATKYAGVTFSEKEKDAFFSLVLTDDHSGK